MNFKELLTGYREGSLSDDEKRMVEEELEKFDAINEFQCEQIERLVEANESEESESKNFKQDQEDFSEKIRAEIRKAFIKTGIIIGCAVIAMVLFIVLALPTVVSGFYYDPGKSVVKSGASDEEIEVNRMSLDIAVYTELRLPEVRRNYVAVDKNGYGNYDIRITKDVWFEGEDTGDISGKVVRNKLKLYNTSALSLMPQNEFAWYQRESTEVPLTEQDKQEAREWAEENPEQDGSIVHGAVERDGSREIIDGLEDNKNYYAYITLNEMMDYEDFYRYYSTHENLSDGWCAVKTEDIEDEESFFPDNVGFVFDASSGTMMDWDREKYPNLFLYDYSKEDVDGESRETKASDSSAVKAHFTDMLEYMSEQSEFTEMMEGDRTDSPYSEELERIKNYVEKEGIRVYGFVARADKQTLSELLDESEIYSIDVKAL